MPRLLPDEDTWPVWQAAGTWLVAVVLLVYEGVGRHFVDQGGLTILGGLLGLPVVMNAERARRKRKQRDEGS